MKTSYNKAFDSEWLSSMLEEETHESDFHLNHQNNEKPYVDRWIIMSVNIVNANELIEKRLAFGMHFHFHSIEMHDFEILNTYV